MKKIIIKNIATGIEKNCDILKKNDNYLEVVIEDTTIKILLKKNQINLLVLIKKWSLSLKGNHSFRIENSFSLSCFKNFNI